MTTRHEGPSSTSGSTPPADRNAVDRFPQGLITMLIIGLAGMVALFAALQHWNMAAVSTGNDVAQTVSRLEPACRPIMAARFRTELLRRGRPLTRAEVDQVADGIKDCAAIEDQVSGLQG